VEQGWYFNPGSISLAYNWGRSTKLIQADPWADYAIVSTAGDTFGITFCHVPFDVDKLAQIIRASGRPYAEEAVGVYRR
jgi:hypothetical protein